MKHPEDISIRDYLRAGRWGAEDVCPEYEDFLEIVEKFFRCRVSAEERFRRNRHLAFNAKEALPVSWLTIKSIFEKNSAEPPETIVTQIARNTLSSIEHVISQPRKVLARVDRMTPIGRVQQIDRHGLRWLSRQPGRNFHEKAVIASSIVAVQREDNYNTLENRVVKDFLRRVTNLAFAYLRKHSEHFPEHQTIRLVSRLRRVCQDGLGRAFLRGVSLLRELPNPNFVLRQDRNYSRIWAEYQRVVSQANAAELLWKQHDELEDVYLKVLDMCPVNAHPNAKYRYDVWINQLDGRHEILDNLYEGPNEVLPQAKVDFERAGEDVEFVDLTNPPDSRFELCWSACHSNARPYLRDYRHLNPEPTTKVLSLGQIIRTEDYDSLHEYLGQLYGLIAGERWVVLVPDDWDAKKLEAIIKCMPRALNRDQVFLLWRSIAAVLSPEVDLRDCRNGDVICVVDANADGTVVATKLKLMVEDGALVPQRASMRVHPERYCVKCAKMAVAISEGRIQNFQARVVDVFKEFVNDCSKIFVSGIVTGNGLPVQKVKFLCGGAQRYDALKNEGRTPYFDELEALSLVMQMRSEQVVVKQLIEHIECYPGGRTFKRKNVSAGSLRQGERQLSLYLFEGEPMAEDKLQESITELGFELPETCDITLNVKMTPGQGLAHVAFSASCLENDIVLNLEDLKPSEMTLRRIQNEIKRSFPPDIPLVEASEEMWTSVSSDFQNFLNTGFLDLRFVRYYPREQSYWGIVEAAAPWYRPFGPERHIDYSCDSPIDNLKKENVFGNASDHRLPRVQFEFQSLFESLASGYRSGQTNFLKIIGWSYQFDNPAFDAIKDEIYHEYVNGLTLTAQKYTVCSNLFGDGDERIVGIVRECSRRMQNVATLKADDLRLLMNHLKFHPSCLKDISDSVCNNIMGNAQSLYASFVQGIGRVVPPEVGYTLGIMLFMLNRRRYSPDFYSKEYLQVAEGDEWCPRGALGNELTTETPARARNEQTRKFFIDYVNGKGTLEGFPSI